MADFVAITVEGTSYTVKDATARESAQNAVTTANQANTAAGQAQQKANQNETDITNLAGDSLTVSYVPESESIAFTKGIDLK